MKISKSLFVAFTCIIINSCNSTDSLPVILDSQQTGFDGSQSVAPKTQRQDGSIIVKPQGMDKVRRKEINTSEVLGAAEREVVRRQQLSKEADVDLNDAIEDVNSGDLDSARSKLKKAVGKYPR